jgi:hypothetical protein
MGPMSKIRERLYLDSKIMKPEQKDNIESAIERAYKAYEQIDVPTIMKGWKQICPLL